MDDPERLFLPRISDGVIAGATSVQLKRLTTRPNPADGCSGPRGSRPSWNSRKMGRISFGVYGPTGVSQEQGLFALLARCRLPVFQVLLRKHPMNQNPGRKWLTVSWAAAGVLLAMVLTAALSLPGLEEQRFWDDEAYTAIYARNLLRFGRFTAWDGNNVVAYGFGRFVGEDLGRELRVPGLPAVMAAAGFVVLGETTFAGRFPFVLVGFATIVATGWWLRRHWGRRSPWFGPPLLLALSPAFLLYIRNCRYYAPAIFLTVLLLGLWAPSAASSGHRVRLWQGTRRRRTFVEMAGVAVTVCLLMSTHYLNAAAVLAILPVFFLDRRYRWRRQLLLLAAAWATAIAFGTWQLTNSNPWGAADYGDVGVSSAAQFVPLRRFALNVWWYLRDLGNAEMLPWALVPALLLPWVVPGCASRRALVRRTVLLLVALFLYVMVTAALLPPDMGGGPRAEMRYVVPLLAIGASVGAAALAVIGSLSRIVMIFVLVVLVGSNTFHLSFLAQRADGANAWGSTLARYVAELSTGYQTGNEALIALLEELPERATIRIRPVFMTAPAIFYVPKHRYCDQLTVRKPIAPQLRRHLPDHVFVERCRPDIVIAPGDALADVLQSLESDFGNGAYRARKALGPYWYYASKPDVLAHFFSPPDDDWMRWPGMVALVRRGTPLDGHRALQTVEDDVEGNWRLGVTLINAGRVGQAVDHCRKVMRADAGCVPRCVGLAERLAASGKADASAALYAAVLEFEPERATDYLTLSTLRVDLAQPWLAVPLCDAVVRRQPSNIRARLGLGIALAALGRHEAAVDCYRQVLLREPKLAVVHIYLGKALAACERCEEAIEHLRRAKAAFKHDAALAAQIDRVIRRCEERLEESLNAANAEAGEPRGR